jgi:hypothetical protein
VHAGTIFLVHTTRLSAFVERMLLEELDRSVAISWVALVRIAANTVIYSLNNCQSLQSGSAIEIILNELVSWKIAKTYMS